MTDEQYHRSILAKHAALVPEARQLQKRVFAPDGKVDNEILLRWQRLTAEKNRLYRMAAKSWQNLTAEQRKDPANIP